MKVDSLNSITGILSSNINIICGNATMQFYTLVCSNL